MERGYVKLWRKTLDSGLLQHPTAWQVFCFLLLSATRTPRKVIISGMVFDLEPGEHVTSVAKICAELNITPRQCRTAISLLEKMKISTSRTTNKSTVFSILNWDSYQNSEKQNDKQDDTQATNTRQAYIKQELKKLKEDTNVSLSISPEKDEQAEESVPRETVPVQRILDLYREELPFLRQPRMVRPNVAASIRARWSEKKKEGKFQDEEGGLAYFRHVFRYVSQNAFLSGRKTNWKSDFEWIVKAANWDKITTGKYAEDDGK